MSLLLGLMGRIGPKFNRGNLRALRPAFDAIDSFLFCAGHRTDRAPHVRDPNNVKRYTLAVVAALLPIIAAAVYFFGWRIVAMIGVTYVTGLAIELGFAMFRKEALGEGLLVTSLLYPLILPPQLPFWMTAAGIAFGVVVGKELFGGTGRNFLNPALAGRCFLQIGLHADWSSLLFGTASASGVSGGCAGEVCSVLIILAGVFLVLAGVVNWRTILSLLGSFAILAGVAAWASPEAFGRPGWTPPAVAAWHLQAGGLLFGAVFLAADPATSPVSNLGKWIYGVTIGASTFLIRYLSGCVEGVMFAILLGNVAAPLCDKIATHVHLRKLRYEG